MCCRTGRWMWWTVMKKASWRQVFVRGKLSAAGLLVRRRMVMTKHFWHFINHLCHRSFVVSFAVLFVVSLKNRIYWRPSTKNGYSCSFARCNCMQTAPLTHAPQPRHLFPCPQCSPSRRQVAEGNYAFLASSEAAEYYLSKIDPKVACLVHKLHVSYSPGGIALGLQKHSPYRELFNHGFVCRAADNAVTLILQKNVPIKQNLEGF